MTIHPRLLNQLFENPSFTIDNESVAYIVRDIINMNWWNTCGFVIGYKNNRRVFSKVHKQQKAIALTLKEYYRINLLSMRDEDLLLQELKKYISGAKINLRQLRLWSMTDRRNPSQYYRDEKTKEVTWLDCTSRAKYAFSYLGCNGYIDYDGSCRILGANKINEWLKDGILHDIGARFVEGVGLVKQEIFSQKKQQDTVETWCEKLGIKVLSEKQWLFEQIKKVRTDPYKKWEALQIELGNAYGVNECLYGYIVGSASKVSGASSVSRASSASDVSRASDVSSTSNTSSAGPPPFKLVTKNWFDEPKAFGPVPGLIHPEQFCANKCGLAGHWKINHELVKSAKKGWFDPFMGHGESPLLAKRLGIKYVGHEISKAPFKNYLHYLQKVIDDKNVEIKNFDSKIYRPELEDQFDLCYTSPPYFDYEEYSPENWEQVKQSKDYDDWLEKIMRPVLNNVYKYLTSDGVLALQTEKNKNCKKRWINFVQTIGFVLIRDTLQGHISEYSKFSKKDQTLIIFKKRDNINN